MVPIFAYICIDLYYKIHNYQNSFIMKSLSHLLLGSACVFGAIAFSSCESNELPKEESPKINSMSIHTNISNYLKDMNAEYNNGSGTEGVYQISGEEKTNNHIESINSFKINDFGIEFEDFVVENLTKSNNSTLQQVTANLVSNATINPIESKSQLPSRIKALYSIGLDRVNSLGVYIRNWEVNAAGIEEITLNDITITFPKYVRFENGTNVYKISHVTLNESNTFYKLINYKIKGIKIGEDEQCEFISNEDGVNYISFAGDVQLNADVTIKYNPSKISRTDLNFDLTHSSYAQDVKNIRGEFDVLDSNIEKTILINNSPSEESSIWNPSQQNDIICEFSYENSSPLALETNVLITPWDTTTNLAVGNPISIDLAGKNCIKPNKKTNFIISSTPQEVNNYESVNIVNENISEMMKSTANAYKISSGKITTNYNYSHALALGKEYRLYGNYKGLISIPFSNFELNYTEKLENLNQIIKNIGENADKVSFRFWAYNTIPTDVEISVDFLDTDGNKLDGLEANSLILKPCKDEIKFSSLSFDLDNLLNNSQFKLLDKIAFNFRTLNEDNSKIRLSPFQQIMITNGSAHFITKFE